MIDEVRCLGQIAYEARFGTVPDRHPIWQALSQDEREIWRRVAAAVCTAAAPVMTATINELSANLKTALSTAEMAATSGAFWARRAETAERRLQQQREA